MQKLMKAAREGTKDGLEKTRAAVKRGRSFIRTKSLMSQGGDLNLCPGPLWPFSSPSLSLLGRAWLSPATPASPSQ